MPQGPFQSTIAKNAAGQSVQSRQGAGGDLFSSALHGSKYNLASTNGLFMGGNATGATLSAALATTYVGLCLSNPATSGKVLAVRRVSGIVVVAPAAFLGLGLITGYSAAGVVTHTTPVADIRPCRLGSAAVPVAKLDAACTIVGTPAWAQFFTNSLVTANNPPGFTVDLEGGIVIPPGGYAAIGGTVAGPTSGFLGSFEWEEVAA